MRLAPIPVVAKIRTFPATPPYGITRGTPFPDRVVIPEVVIGPDGRATCGAYLGDGPDMTEVGGRFLGLAAPQDLVVPGSGPLRQQDRFLDRLIWRAVRESRFGFVTWDPAVFFSSLAYTFRNGGRWAVIFTDPNPSGGRFIDYHRSPIVFAPKANGQVDVRFGPRKDPDARDFENGHQTRGRILSLSRVVSGLCGERVEDLRLACRLFDLQSPPKGPTTPETVWLRTVALRDLYRAVRIEAEVWP